MLREAHRSLILLLVGIGAASGCNVGEHGCLGGDDLRCVPPPACPARPSLVECVAPVGSLRIGSVDFMSWSATRPLGPKVAGAAGDYVLENHLIRVVIDTPEHAQGLAPSGGSIIDLSLVGVQGGDQVNGILQTAGLLPRDAVRYQRAKMIDASPVFVALVVRGHLDGNERVQVVTRYELRPCEAGVRVRTELWNGTREVNTFYLADGFFWGDRGLLPFVPLRGQGFRQPELDLLKLSEAWRNAPFFAARAQAEPDVGYVVVPCGAKRLAGFNDPTLSAAGVGLAPTLPQDGIAYERTIFVARGPGLAPAVGEALRARADFHGEPMPAKVVGRVVTGPERVALDGRKGRAASLLVYEPAKGGDPDDEAGRTPWSEAVPARDGRFQLELPAGRDFRVQPHAFGRVAGAAVAFSTGEPGSTFDVGDILIERPARLTIRVEDVEGQAAPYAEAVLVPVAPRTAGAASSLYGLFAECEPMLGAPHGGSPACNRALVVDGSVDLLAPGGHYFVYATRGPFSTLSRKEVRLEPGADERVTLRSTSLPLLPPGVLSGDFHVHGGASFDSSLPDIDRVLSFLASGIDVIAATDHDVIVTYGEAMKALGAATKLVIMPGVETTPNILWFRVPGEKFPKTLGHFNFWPVRHEAFLPRRGAPWDELIEPGAMMDAFEPLWVSRAASVRQMNHPWSDDKLGRDQGFLRAIQYDPRLSIERRRSFGGEVLLARSGRIHRNIDFDAQEVMTGANRRDWIRYRALWFSFLNQGFLKAGTANSDTHTFAIEKAGYPRTLVWGTHSVAGFDPLAFNADIKAGKLVGTNGPVLDVRIVDAASGAEARPSLQTIVPAADAVLVVRVGVAPWIPVTEVRFVVNGSVVKSAPVALGDGGDPFGLDRHAEVRVPLAELLARVKGDAWLVVETGLPLPLSADLDDDGLADTLDNNGDGHVDAADIPEDDDDDDDDDEEARRFPNPGIPAVMDHRYHLEAVAPGTWPYAFTNPFVLNLDGAFWLPPGVE